MTQSSVVVEGRKLQWHEQRTLFCADGTKLFVIDNGLWVRTKPTGERQTGDAPNIEAAVQEAARGQALGDREWLCSWAADAGDGVLVYAYPVNAAWRFLIKLGSETRFVGDSPTADAAKRDAESTLNKARMRAAMPATAQPWGRA